MTKTKSQLRAEAVERLRELDAYVDGPESIVDKLVGEIETDRFNYHVEIEYIIDLLTDEEPQDGTTPEFDVPLYGWHEGDTREKLEADILAYRGKPSEVVNMIPVWLDRQAAITRAEDERICYTCRDEQVDELQAELDEYKENFTGFGLLKDLNEAGIRAIYLPSERRFTFKCDGCSWMSLAAQPDTEAYDRISELQEQVDGLQHELETRIEQSIGLDTANKHLEDENARLRSCISDDAEYSKLVMGEYRELRAKLDDIAKVVER